MATYLQTWCPGTPCDPCLTTTCSIIRLAQPTIYVDHRSYLLDSTLSDSYPEHYNCDPFVIIFFGVPLNLLWPLTGAGGITNPNTNVVTLRILSGGALLDSVSTTLTGTVSGPFWSADWTLPYAGGVFQCSGRPTVFRPIGTEAVRLEMQTTITASWSGLPAAVDVVYHA
jgi:hypothetical protein